MKKLLIATFVCFAFSAEAAQTISITPAQIKALGIQTTALTSQANGTSQRLPGEIVVPIEQARIVSAPQPGLIDQVMVAAGQQVKQGQVLAHLSSPELVALQRDHLQALSQHKLSDNAYKRDTELYKDGIIAERRYLTTETTHTELNALLNERRQALRLSGMSPQAIKQLESSGIYTNGVSLSAPIDGVVLEQMVTAGQRVDSATPLYRIGKLSPLWLEMHVPIQALSGIKLGMPARVSNTEANGKVIAIVPSINKLDQTALVRVLLNKSANALAPGQMVEAEIAQSGINTNRFSVPKEALTQVSNAKNVNQSFVFVKAKNGFEARPVNVVGNIGNQSLISGDFSGKEQIVTSGTATLKAKMQGIGEE
jgi:RND family efflux transporter MFP subunit